MGYIIYGVKDIVGISDAKDTQRIEMLEKRNDELEESVKQADKIEVVESKYDDIEKRYEMLEKKVEALEKENHRLSQENSQIRDTSEKLSLAVVPQPIIQKHI